MIPVIVAQVVQQLLSNHKSTKPAGASGFSVPGDASSADSQGSLGSIVHDVGKLTTDALSLLGLGTTGAVASADAGTEAYAATGKLGR